MDCNICHKEEAKSKSLKLNKTKILEREIIPYNQCWNCNVTFRDGEAQLQHFLDEHECQFCIGSRWFHYYFEDPVLKKKHDSEKHAICDSCGCVFENTFEKEDHIEEKHQADNNANVVANL